MRIKNNIVLFDCKDQCICGSGKTFKLCCINKNHIYRTLGCDYSGKQLIYDATELNYFCSNVTNYVEEVLKITKTGIDDALTKLEIIYDKVDKALAPFTRISPCHKGCSYCCRGMVVSTSNLEYLLIKKYIKDKFNVDYSKKLKDKINSNRDLIKSLSSKPFGFSDEKRKEYTRQYIPCVFLNEKNECEIYKVRPFECRAYIVFNDPIDCLNKGKDLHYSAYYFDQARFAILKLNEAYRSSGTYDKHLLTWFIDS